MTVKTMQAEVAICLQRESVIVSIYRDSFHIVNELSSHDQHIVTCIARQRTGKHLATEYTHATIELRMLLLVIRQ
jgi:hypothetical protein